MHLAVRVKKDRKIPARNRPLVPGRARSGDTKLTASARAGCRFRREALQIEPGRLYSEAKRIT